jgi:hypothetical protein
MSGLQRAGSAIRLAAGPAGQAMLDAAEPLRGAHALVLCHGGSAGLDALCGLIGRGCGAAAELSPEGAMAAEPAEIVLVPGLRDLAAAQRAIAVARRCLLPCGRIVLQDCAGGLAREIVRLLRAAGFTGLRTRDGAEGAIISADWPMFGLHAAGRRAGEAGHA